MKKNPLEKVYEKLESKYKTYISSIRESTYETIIDEIPMDTTDFLFKIDINKICKDFLGFDDVNIMQNINNLATLNILKVTKNTTFIVEGELLVLQLKKADQILSFFNKIEAFYTTRKRLINQLIFYKKYHYDQFISEALLRKDIETINYFKLQEIHSKFIVDQPELLTEKNIVIEDIVIDFNTIEDNLIKQIKTKLNNEFKQIKYFNSNYHFKNNDFDFKYFENIDMKSSDMFENFYDTHWHHLGDLNFLEQLEDQIENYDFEHSFDAECFLEHNKTFFLNFKKEAKDKIFNKMSNMTLRDIIEEDGELEQKYKQFLLFRREILDNSRLIADTRKFSKFSFNNSFINNQLQFFNEIFNKLESFNIHSLKHFINMDLELFIKEFDNSKEKTNYNAFLEYDYILSNIQGLLDGYHNKELSFISAGSSYLNILNSFGGFFLILFDMINITQGKTKDFELYKNFFSKAKVKEENYQKRAIFLIFLFSEISFNKAFKKQNIDFMEIYLKDETLFPKNSKSETGVESERRNKTIRRFYKAIKERETFFEDISSLRGVLTKIEHQNLLK